MIGAADRDRFIASTAGIEFGQRQAAQFHIPEYLLRRACSEGRLEHLRVVNALWLTPAAVAAFARSWRARQDAPES
jgi:hypothetical protein